MNYQVEIHFTHRVMAAVLAIALPWFAVRIFLDRNASLGLRAGATLLMALLALQISLGAQIIWTYRSAAMTTGHVLVSVFTLGTTFWLTWIAHRDVVEGNSTA